MRSIRPFAAPAAILLLAAASASATLAQSPSPVADPTGAVEVTAAYAWGPQSRVGTETRVDGHTEVRGNVFVPSVVTTSDPRLAGSVTLTNDLDGYALADSPDKGVVIWRRVWRIENGGGAWEGAAHAISFSDDERASYVVVLRGEGGYAGLLAPMEVSHRPERWDFRGFIVRGDTLPGE